MSTDPIRIEHALIPKKEQYFSRLLDEDFISMRVPQQAKEMDVHQQTIRQWEKEVDWGSIALSYRLQYAKHYPQIDMALINKAKKGSEKAIELFYQRFENWSNKTGIEVRVKKDVLEMDNSVLMAELLKVMREEDKKKELDKAQEASVIQPEATIQ